MNCTTVTFGGTLTDNAWHHLTWIYNGTSESAYLDGTTLGSSNTKSAPADNGALNIGRATSGTEYFNGLFDDVRIYNRALSAGEVMNLSEGMPNTGSGVYALGSALKLNGTLGIYAGGLDASASNYGVTLSGSWINAGEFTKQSGTVTLDGTSDQTISGSTVFHNLTKITASPVTLLLDYSARQSVSGSLTLQGASSNLLSIRSTRMRREPK